MSTVGTSKTKSAEIRSRLNHPIIDSDGHTAEFEPAVFEYLREIAGPAAVERRIPQIYDACLALGRQIDVPAPPTTIISGF